MSTSAAPSETDATFGVFIRANARDAARLSAITSPVRNFVATPQPGIYFMPAENEVQALRDADFLIDNGAHVVEVLDDPTAA